MGSFNFWVKYLKIVSIFFALMGTLWAVIGSFDAFGIYEKYMAQAFFGTNTLPSDAEKVFRFVLAPFGATAAGYFILQYFIAANAFAKREKWAYQAIAVAFTFWFVLDSSLSLFVHGAVFNFVMANLFSLLLMLPVLVFTKKYF